ncbi:unnamed protein product [Prorocentrum cordatum]|uniref:Subtilisin n=1 Tax=Prorocentrum cordatum TaxID=2364126 RepID=A0ABN9Y911_9DINO|nr:unnamed protein product [Polarella glacialis]
MAPSSRALLVAGCAAVAAAETVKFSDYDLGAEFTKCVKISDWNTMGVDDEVEVADYGDDGCCPTDYTPGVALGSGTEYHKGVVRCGLNDDGSRSGMSTGTTCDYGKCFVVNPAFTCSDADSSKMTLGGCCPTTSDYGDDCYGYSKSTSNSVEYCSTYKVVGFSWETLGSSATDDDIADGALAWGTAVGGSGVYNYGLCGSSGGLPAPASLARRSAALAGLSALPGLAAAALAAHAA